MSLPSLAFLKSEFQPQSYQRKVVHLLKSEKEVTLHAFRLEFKRLKADRDVGHEKTARSPDEKTCQEGETVVERKRGEIDYYHPQFLIGHGLRGKQRQL